MQYVLKIISFFIISKDKRRKFQRKHGILPKYIPVYSDTDTICRKMSLIQNGDIFTMQNSIKMYCPLYPWDVIQRTIVNTSNFFERDILYSLLKYLPKNATVLDVGANIGNHSVFFATIGGAKRVIAFEPIPESFRMLKKNIKINKIDDIVTVFNLGLGSYNSDGEIDFMASDNIGGTSIKASETKNKYTVSIVALDQFKLDIKKLDFIKIDVEGFEIEALKGMKNIIKKYKPIIFIESFPAHCHDYLPCHAEEVMRIMKSLGYNQPISFPEYNWLFLPYNAGGKNI